MTCAIAPRLLRFSGWWELPCCVRVLCRGSRVLAHSDLGHCRAIYTSPRPFSKDYLLKFTSKSKKRRWYDSSWNLPTENKPPALLALMNSQQGVKRTEHVRIRVLNGILYTAITSLLNTSEVSNEVYDRCIELSKVSVSADFSVCRAYWLGSGNKDNDKEIAIILEKYAPRFRHLLISHRVLGNVPPVVFVRDKDDAKRKEVEDLLSSLQFENDDVSCIETDVYRNPNEESKEASATALPSIFGIDHAEMNQQILAYKKKFMKSKEIKDDRSDFTQQQQEQLAAIRKQNLQKKKMKRQRGSVQDFGPQEYLLDRAMKSDRPEELDFDLQEDLVDIDEDDPQK